MEGVSFEVPSEVVTTAALEEKLSPAYQKLGAAKGQVEALTGIKERRWWPEGFKVSEGAASVVKKLLAQHHVEPSSVDALVFTGICREFVEPATACKVAHDAGLHEATLVYDLSNACTGAVNGLIDIANRIELGQIKAGVVVTCESAREIVEATISWINGDPTWKTFQDSAATLTGGSGAAAFLLSDGSLKNGHKHRITSAANHADLNQHHLCRWGLNLNQTPGQFDWYCVTDGKNLLEKGLPVVGNAWGKFIEESGWQPSQIDKVIMHQVTKQHRMEVLKTIDMDPAKEFLSFEYLGNMASVSLPATLALADENGFIDSGDRVSLVAFGSGLNSIVVGVEW